MLQKSCLYVLLLFFVSQTALGSPPPKPLSPILVIDTGFDIENTALKNKLASTPGLLHQGFGENLPSFTQDIANNKIALKSHGTMTADIATKGLPNPLMIVTDILRQANEELFQKTSQLIQKHSIKYVNMSFDLVAPYEEPSEITFDVEPDLRPPLKQMMLDNPSTLFVAVSGNNGLGFSFGVDLDTPWQEVIYPAMAKVPHAIIVGATDSSQIIKNKLHTYNIADFSNYGVKYVDILAPGTNICAAKIGGGSVCANGTSFATPQVLNLAVQIGAILPTFTPLEIKELLMKAAYVPLEKNLPVKSGGILFPERSLLVAKYLKAMSPSKVTIQQAVIHIRKNEQTPPMGESNSMEFMHQLAQFWRHRRL